MFRLGGFYITVNGRLVKIFNSFPFQDGFTLNAAIYQVGGGWVPVRYKPDGTCNASNENNRIIPTETFEGYLKYLKFTIYCIDRLNNLWSAIAQDPHGSTVVNLSNIERRERVLELVQLGAEQKLLEWMQEAGFDEFDKETTLGA